MYRETQDPGNWSHFLKRRDNKGLSLMEAKRKYLKEQLEYDSFINMQLARFEMNRQALLVQGGGGNPDAFEDILNWVWETQGLAVVSGGTALFEVEFESQINFTNVGADLVHLLVPNGQQGNGTAATIPFTASKVTEGGRTIQFSYAQSANAAAQGAWAANVLGTGSINSLVSTPAVNAVGGQYNAVANTATNSGANQVINITVATGSSVDTTADALVAAINQNTNGAAAATYNDVTFSTVGSGINLTASVTINGGGVVSSITVANGGSGYVNGEQITAAAALIGNGSQDLIIVLTSADLVGGAVTSVVQTQGTLFRPNDTITVTAGEIGTNSTGPIFTIPGTALVGDRVGYASGATGAIQVSGSARLFNPDDTDVTIDNTFLGTQLRSGTVRFATGSAV